MRPKCAVIFKRPRKPELDKKKRLAANRYISSLQYNDCGGRTFAPLDFEK